MPPVVIGAGIAAAGTIGGAALANKGASKAAKATQAAADTSAQVQRETYQQSAEALAPYRNAGIPATNTINALLGLGGTQQQAPQQANALYQGYNPDTSSYMGGYPTNAFAAREAIANGTFGNYGPSAATSGYSAPAATGASPSVSQQEAADNAFDIFRNSSGYKFRFDQGMDALNSGYAGRGTLQSGDAIQSAIDYGQGAGSAEFGNFLNALGNQQALGFSAASAQAGVGQNYANSIGNIYMAQGQNQANAALLKSQNTGNAIAGISNIAGGLFAPKYNSLSSLVPSASQTITNNPSIF